MTAGFPCDALHAMMLQEGITRPGARLLGFSAFETIGNMFLRQGMVVHTCKLSTQEDEARGL
jgi:hypothetical protein